MIQINNVSLQVDERIILQNVSLKINKGETVIILGPSGAGKSSILKIMLGLWTPQSGSVIIDGKNIAALSENEILPIRRNMGMVFQSNALFDSLTVNENVGFFLKEKKELNNSEIRARVKEALEFVNLSGTDDLYPDQLSGGMKKRVAIARALALNPNILLYDEPTTGLDPINSKIVIELIEKAKSRGATAIVVTHILQDAICIGDKLTLMNNGQIVETNTVDNLLDSPNPFVQEFFFTTKRELEMLKAHSSKKNKN